MSITLFHHPFSRAAGTVWQLEEVGVEHELRFVDMLAGEQKSPEIRALNPMGKLPILKDGELVVTEGAAIGLYLADRYAPGRLAPTLDDPARGTYLRWSCFASAVIEPAVMSKLGGWDYNPGSAGWGEYDAMLASIEHALEGREFVLGDRFSMADVIFGGTLRYLMSVETIEARPAFVAYAERLSARPASKRADERNAAIVAERGMAG
jgi:glutathione S-transferase